MMNKTKIISILLLVIIACACNNNKGASHNTMAKKQTSNTQKIAIPYNVANRYFVNNTVSNNANSAIPTKITNEKDFEKYFGAAPVMGKDGEPTKIDFTKEYVIDVSEKETYYSTTISPISLNRDEKGDIVFTYKIDKGDKQSYSIVPCLLIIVSNKYQGQVIIKQGL